MGIKEKIAEKALEEITEKLIGDLGILHSGSAVTIENKSGLNLVRIPNKSFFFARAHKLGLRPLGAFGAIPPDADVDTGEIEGFDIIFSRAFSHMIVVWGGCKWVTLWKFGEFELLTGIWITYKTNIGPELRNPWIATSIRKTGGFSRMSKVELADYLSSYSTQHTSDSSLDSYKSFGAIGYKGDGHHHFDIDLSQDD